MNKLPYETATSGHRALEEVGKILKSFGCAKFGHMLDHDEGCLIVQFEYRGRQVSIKASFNGYAAAWLKRHPFNSWVRVSRAAHETKAKDIAAIAVHSIVRDWIKGQVTAVETGILSFEGAFLGQILLPNGKTVFEAVTTQKLLPPPQGGSHENRTDAG